MLRETSPLSAFLCFLGWFTVVTCAAQESAPKATTTGTAGSATPNRIVLRVGSTTLTESEFKQLCGDFLKEQEGTSPSQCKKLAENLAGALMLSQEAVAQKLDQSPEVERQLRMARIQTLSNAQYEQLQEKAKPTPEQIARYYDGHSAEFEEVELRRVFIYKQTPTSRGNGLPAAEAQVRANDIRKALATGADPTPLIQATKDAIVTPALPFKRDELPPYMAHAFDMKVGEWSQVADTPDSLILFQVVKRERMPLSQASPVISKTLEAQTLKEDMDALKQKVGVWMDPQFFDGNTASAMAGSVDKSVSSKKAQQ